MHALFATLLLFLATLAPAMAAPVDLSGTWVLDLAASGDLDPLLKARGASWVERKAAASLEVTKTIAQTGDTLQVLTTSKVKTHSEQVVVDGATRPQTSPKGEAFSVTNRWDGAVWENHTVFTDPAGQIVDATVRHALSADGSMLTMQVRFVKGGAAPVTVDRMFRRR